MWAKRRIFFINVEPVGAVAVVPDAVISALLPQDSIPTNLISDIHTYSFSALPPTMDYTLIFARIMRGF